MKERISLQALELVIFDMDGLLFDTGRIAYQAYLESAKIHNFEMIQDVYYYLTGRTPQAVMDGLYALYGKDSDVAVWRKTMVDKRIASIEAADAVGVKPGAKKLIAFLKEKKIPIALASSNTKQNIERYLQMEALEDQFDYILHGGMVTQGKPNPEIFLKACEHACVNPENTIILEDSMAGIQAGNAANIPVFLVRDSLDDMPRYSGKHKLQTKIELDYSGVHEEFSSLFQVLAYFNEEGDET